MIGTPEATYAALSRQLSGADRFGHGRPRFAEMTALHGAVICNQPSIVKY
jgi:hypothetical protein